MNGSEPVAYRTKAGTILCLDPLCLAAYAEEMLAAKPLTQDDVAIEQDDLEGRTVKCACCDVALDLYTLTDGRISR